MGKIAFIFPGQGAQSVGMGKSLFEHSSAARKVIEQFNQWTKPELQDITFNGPEETLKRTLYTQPAILAVSIAALEAFRMECRIEPDIAAGHSLGEYAALYAAGVIDLETSARLIQKRAELMDTAPAGAMAAILSLPQVEVDAIVLNVKSQSLGEITVANYNTAEQHVVSGSQAAVDAVCALAKEAGGKAIPLVVGGAFHSPLMRPAGEAFQDFVTPFTFQDGAFPVVTNVDAQLTTSGSTCREKLSQQIFSSVLWFDTMCRMRDEGVTTYIEFGPGKVLNGMLKRFDKEARLFNVSDADSLQQTIASVKERTYA